MLKPNMSKVIELLATGFYSGRLPKAPGTWGTLVGIPVAYLFTLFDPVAAMLFEVAFIMAASAIAESYQNQKGGHDRQEIVIDEIVGFAIAMTWIPFTWRAVAIGFVLFRFFDALKPWPINVIDRRIKGGFGVVADDVVAGLIVNLILQVLLNRTNWLGVQIFQG